MTDLLYRPVLRTDAPAPSDALWLAGGSSWFDELLCLTRGGAPYRVAAGAVPTAVLHRLTAPRAEIAGLDMARPQIMGIVNVTPDSFSDGGVHLATDTAVAAGLAMADAGASILDIGGESTRPGAAEVPIDDEIARVVPVIAGIRAQSDIAISVDTRKAPVARAALDAGASLVNDVAGFTFDPALAPLCARAGVPVCIMHSQGGPETMQDDPRYESVVHDVYDFLETRLQALEGQGIPRDRILVDPGIGFGKTVGHNLALVHHIGVLHGLGAAILLGVSRKGFIGRIGEEPRASARAPGSIALGLAALAEGVQLLRVHDVAETAQAIRLWQAVRDVHAAKE